MPDKLNFEKAQIEARNVHEQARKKSLEELRDLGEGMEELSILDIKDQDIESDHLEKGSEEYEKIIAEDKRKLDSFIDYRGIKEEDVPLVEELSEFSNVFFIHYHNFFQPFGRYVRGETEEERKESNNDANARMMRELDGNLRELDMMIEQAGEIIRKELEAKKVFVKKLYKFAEKYGWAVSWNLISVMESRKIKG